MREQAALLPGSQAGEEGTSVWSHGAHRFPFTYTSSHLPSTPTSPFPSPPPTLSDFFLSLFLMSLTFSSHLRTSVSLRLPRGPTQIRSRKKRCEKKKGKKDKFLQLARETQTNIFFFFFNKQQDVTRDGRIFLRATDMFQGTLKKKQKKHSFYIYTLCLSPVVERGCGS